MRSSTAEMVENKVLEMAQHASFHQHVSYNLSTILHALTAGKTDPTEIAATFSRARGLEVITRVVSGEPVARPPVVGLCCGVARRVVDKFGPGIPEAQAEGVVEALVSRLDRGIDGDDAQTMDCQVECARLISSIAGRDADTLLAGGALRSIESMLERLAGKHSSILQPCCEALEHVSRTVEGKAVLEQRGTAGVLLSTIRDCPEALEEGSDAALAPALKVVETIFSNRTPEECARFVHPASTSRPSDGDGSESTDARDLPPPPCANPECNTEGDAAQCVETLLAVAEATSAAPGVAAATCLWWLSGASDKVTGRALDALIAAATSAPAAGEESGGAEAGDASNLPLDTGEEAASARGEGWSTAEISCNDSDGDDWSWLRPEAPVDSGENEAAALLPPPPPPDEKGLGGKEGMQAVAGAIKPLPAARFLAALCLCKFGLQALGSGLRERSPHRVEALVKLCGATNPELARACFRVAERLAGSELGAREFVKAGVLEEAAEAGERFERAGRDGEGGGFVGDAEAHAIAAALAAVAALGKMGGKCGWGAIDNAYRLSVRCLAGVGELSGRPAAAVAKAALDVITFRLTRSDRAGTGGGRSLPVPTAKAVTATDKDDSGVDESASSTPPAGYNDTNGRVNDDQNGDLADDDDQTVCKGAGVDGAPGSLDEPMVVLKDGSGILATMKAHPTDAKVQESGWRALIAMDTGRGDVEKFLVNGDEQERGREMLRDCIKRHGGDSAVAGQVTAMLESLVLQGDSDGDPTSLTTSPSEEGNEEDRWPGAPTDATESTAENETVEENMSIDVIVDDDAGESAAGGSDGDEGSAEESIREDGEHEGVGDVDQVAAAAVATAILPQEDPAEAGVLDNDTADDMDDADAAVTEQTETGRDVVDGQAASSEEQHLQEESCDGSAATDGPVGGEGTTSVSDADGGGDEPIVATPEVVAHLHLAGEKALLGDLSSGSSDGGVGGIGDETPSVADSPETMGEPTADPPSASTQGTAIARELFAVADDGDGDGDGAGVTTQNGEEEEKPLVLSEDEIRLEESWMALEKLHDDITGRSQIIGGESADLVAGIPDPKDLRKEVGVALHSVGGEAARGAVAASHLAIVGALTATTDALASSQQEVQRYLTMSRDLHGTSTWKDMSDAMQWTMDSLKGTVVLFTPHTSTGMSKDVGLCVKSEAAASKLFKEAALQIKIVVVELAGEHAPNTVWRIPPGKFEGLAENRKIMVLRHLRSLVVAYDNLSELSRRDLTTALEIIKNREVLNKMGKICVEAEWSEEQRNKARIASANEKLGIGTRRGSGNRSSFPGRSPSPSTSRISPASSPIAHGANSPTPPQSKPRALIVRTVPTPTPPPPPRHTRTGARSSSFTRRSASPNASRIHSPRKPSSTAQTNGTSNATRALFPPAPSPGAGLRSPHTSSNISPSFVGNNGSSSNNNNSASISPPIHLGHGGAAGGTYKTPIGKNNSIRSAGSSDSINGGVGSAGSGSSRISRGIAAKSRRRDASATGTRSAPGSGGSRKNRSKSPVPASTRSSRLRAKSKSPVPGNDRHKHNVHGAGGGYWTRSRSPGRSSTSSQLPKSPRSPSSSRS